jgi:hypothetical protein
MTTKKTKPTKEKTKKVKVKSDAGSTDTKSDRPKKNPAKKPK